MKVDVGERDAVPVALRLTVTVSVGDGECVLVTLDPKEGVILAVIDMLRVRDLDIDMVTPIVGVRLAVDVVDSDRVALALKEVLLESDFVVDGTGLTDMEAVLEDEGEGNASLPVTSVYSRLWRGDKMSWSIVHIT